MRNFLTWINHLPKIQAAKQGGAIAADVPAAWTAPVRMTRRGQERRQQILQSATRHFLEQGYSGVVLDDIVGEAGGSKANVYSYFGGKEGLFRTVVQGLCDDFLQGFRQIRLSGLSARRGLRRMGLALLGVLLQERHIAFQRMVTAESGRLPGLGQAWFDGGPQQSRQMMADFIALQQQAGTLRPFPPLAAAMLFHDMLVSNPVYLGTIGRPLSGVAVRRHVRQTLDLFFRGLEA